MQEHPVTTVLRHSPLVSDFRMSSAACQTQIFWMFLKVCSWWHGVAVRGSGLVEAVHNTDGCESPTHSGNCHFQVFFLLLLLLFSFLFSSSFGSSFPSLFLISLTVFLSLCDSVVITLYWSIWFRKMNVITAGKTNYLCLYFKYYLNWVTTASFPVCSSYPCLSKLQGSLHSKFIGVSIFGVCQKWRGSREYSSTSRQSLHKPGSIYGLDT